MTLGPLTLGLLTLDIVWEKPLENRGKIEKLLSTHKAGELDVIVLPEMFTTGFSMDSQRIAEPYKGKQSESIIWMAKMAAQFDACICGSIAFKEGDTCYNRLIWMPPNGNFSVYDKRHLFSMADEDKHFQAGGERLIVEHKGWRICPLVCYDLRFPVWSKNVLTDQGPAYDLLIYVANWPTPRYNAWVALLQARSIENLSFCAGVNRIGQDSNGHHYTGGSLVYDFKGNEMVQSSQNNEELTVVTLEKTALDEFRTKFPALRDADQFVLLP